MGIQVELRHLRIPMTEPFRISSGEVRVKDCILVRIERDAISGFGEASPMAGSFYSENTPETAWDFLTGIAVPKITSEPSLRPEHLAGCVDEHPFDSFAWAGIEGALWDLTVQEEGTSFPHRLGVKISSVASGLALGIYPSIEELLEASSKYLQAGYKRIKIKIEPGWDVEPVKALRETFKNIPLMVDANGAYTEADFSIFQRLDNLGLLMIEQPLAKDNLVGHARLQERLSTPVCLDESSWSKAMVERAIKLGACRIVNLKIQHLGGILRTKEVYHICENANIPTWMGTMPELGVGALHALYMSMMPNCVYPTDVEASRRWFLEEIIDPPIEVTDGVIEIPREHHIRPNVNMDVVDRYTSRLENMLV